MQDQEQIIKDCLANNRQGQEKLYRTVYPALMLLCKRFFADEHTALEVLNDGMLKVYRQIGKYDSTKGDLFNWIYTIVRNTALDKLKLSALPLTSEINDDDPGLFSVTPLNSLEEKEFYVFLDVLSPATRAVCSLYYFEGFNIREIAEILNCSVGTIKWHLSETRNKLRPVLKKYYFK